MKRGVIHIDTVNLTAYRPEKGQIKNDDPRSYSLQCLCLASTSYSVGILHLKLGKLRAFCHPEMH